MSEETARRYLPPPGIWILFVVCLVLATWLQVSQAPGDRGTTNIIEFGLFMICAFTAGVWFSLFSAFDKKLRRGVPAALVALLVVFFSLFRIDNFGGDMAPHFMWRFAEAADRALEVPAPGSGDDIDLATTGPWDFPQFLGPSRDLSVDTVVLSRDWESQPPEMIWRQPIGAGWSSFAVVNGYAVTQEQRGDLEMITCYEVETGELVWSFSIENRFESIIAGTGPRATPTVDEGIVYALTNNGTIVALDGADGSLLWQHDLPAEYGVSPEQELATVAYGRANSPLVVGPLVIVPAGGAPGGRLVSLVAFDKKSGEKIWEGGDRQISYGSPAVATLAGVEQVLTVNEASASGHYLESGEVLWEVTRPGVTNADPNASQAVPVPPNRVFVSKGYGLGGALFELAAQPDGTMSVQEVWTSSRVLRTKFTNVTIYDGHIYGLSDGILECVDLETGERVWKHGRYHQGQILRAHDLLIVLSEEGEVFLIEATPERRDNVFGSFQALSGKTWNNFALYGPYLVVRNAVEAAVYRLPLVN